MTVVKRITRFSPFLELLLFLIIIFFSIRPVENYDFWFHAKYGEYILNTHSLPFRDVFSHTAYGSSAVPYEWLFQVVIYLVYHYLGAVGVQIIVVALVFAYFFLFRQILLEIFHLGLLPRILFISFLYLLEYDFWVERPQSAAYLLFMAVLYLVLKRIFSQKNLLILTLPLFFLWTNLHASMILGLYLFFGFGAVAILLYFWQKDKLHLALARDLFIFGLVNILVTVLPPLGIKVYQLLYQFFEKREFISVAISEWAPLPKLTALFYLYLVIIVAALVAFLWSLVKDQKERRSWFFLPFIPLGLFVISGIRQAPFTMPVLFLLFIPAIKIVKINFRSQAIFFLNLIIILSATSILYFYYRAGDLDFSPNYPVQAIPFIRENLKGNMFNEYHLGGYLMYHLGPEIKTFIDGRTDMFLPTVLPEYIGFRQLAAADDAKFLSYFNKLTEKYRVSWAILTTNRFSLSSRLARLLGEDPSWHLVFFDDQARIFVRDDGINKRAIADFGLKAVTPLQKKLYKSDSRELAWIEYENMYKRAKSATAANALGFMLLEDGKFEEAKSRFLDALAIDPKAPAPKMNLAELSVKDGDYKEAITFYRQAIKDDPERGLAYLRLGQLIIASGGSEREAREIWQKGLKATPDEEILKQLREALMSHSST
jgi:tetratricopeptide (TPR) repeat protein